MRGRERERQRSDMLASEAGGRGWVGRKKASGRLGGKTLTMVAGNAYW